MQEHGSGAPSKLGDYRDSVADASRSHQGEDYQTSTHQYALMQQSNYGCSSKDLSEPNITYYRAASGIYEGSACSQSYSNQSVSGMVSDHSASADKLSQSSWSINSQEPIGTGAKKKIIKSQDKRGPYIAPRYQEKYKDISIETERQGKLHRIITSESTSSLDYFAVGERMVSELCNISDSNSQINCINQKQIVKSNDNDEQKTKTSGSSETLLTALDKIIIHDQIPNQIVQLAIEACTDAENIAIAHHNRPCFKNIHSICAKTRSNVQKPDSAVANLHSQGVPWVIKNFIFSFVRILDGWKGVKELLSEKHDTFSRIENKYYSPNIRECFVQWQAVTKEMLTHIYKTFKCLNHGFAMEQKSFTHNYYATNSAAPRHHNQTKFQPQVKPHSNTSRSVAASPQLYPMVQPPWTINHQIQSPSQTFSENTWPMRPNIPYKKLPVISPTNAHNFYPLNDHNELENFHRTPYNTCDTSIIREAKPRQSWTITNVPDYRNLEGLCLSDQRELYNQLKHKIDAELGKAPGQPVIGNITCDLVRRREMELKSKMIPLSHVEKSLIPGMAATSELRECYVQKNNSCGDAKEEIDFFATWGQIVQKEHSEFITHHTPNVQIDTNVVTVSNNVSGPVQYMASENDEFHEVSKVYMKPGSYKVPIKPTDILNSNYVSASSQENINYENSVVDEFSSLINMKVSLPHAPSAPQAKNFDSWPCLMSKRNDDIFGEDLKIKSFDILSSIASDSAWEAAKQSAPKLMNSIHEDFKSDAARLYDALGLSICEERSEDINFTNKNTINYCDGWHSETPINHFFPKDLPILWDQSSEKQDSGQTQKDKINYDNSFSMNTEVESEFEEPLDYTEGKYEETKENKRCPNFDQTGNYVRDESKKKNSVRSKLPGMWYHPKKKKPLQNAVVEKFEFIILKLTQMSEAAFIQHDMDIKMAPRFYEVVKYPMCLHDISTKLRNSSYVEHEQVVQDFRRIFNNVRLYLKSFPDVTMKKNVVKVSSEFEKILIEEFQNRQEIKNKTSGTKDANEVISTKSCSG